MQKPNRLMLSHLSFSIYILIIASLLAFYLYFHHASRVMVGDGVKGPKGMVWVPGGEFVMGSESHLAKANEKPAHKVRVDGFWMDQTDVTNDQFETFVKATGYVTTAEQKPDWDTLKIQLPPGTPKPAGKDLVPGAMVFVGTEAPVPLDDHSRWWRFVPGANWHHPHGPQSNIIGKGDYPVVQVSYQDALAYAKWAGKRLPTEAECEFAARGGLKQADYVWGDEFQPRGKKMANTFAGTQFPVVTPEYRDKVTPSKVASFAANGYGLYDMAGNVWQMVADWYRADAFQVAAAQKNILVNPMGPSDSYDPDDLYSPANAPKRVLRGGSFLCDEHFCMSYRPSSRRCNDPFNPMEHVGFRLVMTPKMFEEARLRMQDKSLIVPGVLAKK